jgi:hypothetical protein
VQGYHADYERAENNEGTWVKLYLNSVPWIKVGQNLWVDCCFSNAVLNGMYYFHASSSAFAGFWNATFLADQENSSIKVSHCQVWHAFVQESVRRVALASDVALELPDRL